MARAQPRQLRRKDDISDSVRTSGKDEAAEYIEKEVVGKGRWPMTYTEIAKETGWSRQHIANTIEDYFTEPGDETSQKTEVGAGHVDGDRSEEWRDGYRRGFRDGFEEAASSR